MFFCTGVMYAFRSVVNLFLFLFYLKGIGKYSSEKATTCSDCTAGYVCVEGSTSATPGVGLCPLGYYCDGTTAQACPSGKYGQKVGGTSEADACLPCPAGYYCEAGTAGYPRYSVKCPPGHFCTTGTERAFQFPCPDGYYNTEIGIENSNQCRECKPGYYCSGGDPTGDSLCPAGHYCLAKTGSSTKYPCDAGYYTEELGTTSMNFFIQHSLIDSLVLPCNIMINFFL